MFRKYAYGWITLGFFLGSLLLHWYFGWNAFADDARSPTGRRRRQTPISNEMLRDTFENWQSEFLQLLWQVLGLAYFLYVGSPASKENDDRIEVKIDAILRAVGGAARRRRHFQDRQGVRAGGRPRTAQARDRNCGERRPGNRRSRGQSVMQIRKWRARKDSNL